MDAKTVVFHSVESCDLEAESCSGDRQALSGLRVNEAQLEEPDGNGRKPGRSKSG